MLDQLTPPQIERLLVRVPTLPETQQRQLLASLAAEVDRRAAADILFWLKFVVTRDESDADETIKAFPHADLAYLRALFGDWIEHAKSVTAKSRQMLVSWALATFATHTARYRANQAVYWQTKAWEDAVAMVCMPTGGFEARCQFIETHLPPWMRQDIKFSEGRMQYPNGSIIQALSGGADKIRGKTASLVIEDEFAFQEDQKGVYTAVMPLVQKGTRVIFVSTPNGTDNMFATLWHGRDVSQSTPTDLAA